METSVAASASKRAPSRRKTKRPSPKDESTDATPTAPVATRPRVATREFHVAPIAPEECIVSLETVHVVRLRTLFETFSTLLVEGNIRFDEHGVHIDEIDVSRTVFVETHLQADRFDDGKYYCKKPTVVGVCFGDILTILKSFNQDDTLVIQMTEESLSYATPYINIYAVYNNEEEKDRYCFDYRVHMLALDSQDIEVPHKKFTTMITMPSIHLQRVLRTSENTSAERIQILAEQHDDVSGCVYFIARDHDSIRMRVAMGFKQQSDSEHETTLRETCKKAEAYSIAKLGVIAKATAMSPHVKLYLLNDYPLVLKYMVGPLGYTRFYLSPYDDTDHDTDHTLALAKHTSKPFSGGTTAAAEAVENDDDAMVDPTDEAVAGDGDE
jgi:proliferating cell nuclear antigen